DIPLVSVYTTGNVLVRGMLIPDAFLTKEIRATDDFKEYEMVFMNVDVPMNQRNWLFLPKERIGDDIDRDEIAEATLISLALHKTTLVAEVQENVAKVQEKLDEEEIEKKVEGEEDEESYASVMTSNNVTFIASFFTAKRNAFWSLKKTFEEYCFDILYAVSIKEDMAYLCLHFTKDHKGTRFNTPYP
nr:hypothetical protein [Tanacetum cinerariifolium]